MQTSFQPPSPPLHGPPPDPIIEENESIDLPAIWRRIKKGLITTIGLALLGIVLGTATYLLAVFYLPVTTSTRVVFSFPGWSKGQYPDGSKFRPDDLRAPEVISAALSRQGMEATERFQGTIRGSLSIIGVIPSNILKERERLRSTGQTPPPFVPDEYEIFLTLPRRFALGNRQRELLLNEIISVYSQRFNETYAKLPISFGNAFQVLGDKDYFEYDLVLNGEINNIEKYLNQLIDAPNNSNEPSRNAELTSARSFRSRTTGLSFGDLAEQTKLFRRIEMSETLGLLAASGLTRNPKTTLVKLDYYVQTLENEERQAISEEAVVMALLLKAQEKTQSYVVGLKSQSRPEGPTVDQGLLESLAANDAYNLLVRRALEAGLQSKRIQAEKERVLEKRTKVAPLLRSRSDNSPVQTEADQALRELQIHYEKLISDLRKTCDDFSRQQYGEAIRLSGTISSDGIMHSAIRSGIMGLFLGLAAGVGLSLLRIDSPRASSTRPEN